MYLLWVNTGGISAFIKFRDTESWLLLSLPCASLSIKVFFNYVIADMIIQFSGSVWLIDKTVQIWKSVDENCLVIEWLHTDSCAVVFLTLKIITKTNLNCSSWIPSCSLSSVLTVFPGSVLQRWGGLRSDFWWPRGKTSEWWRPLTCSSSSSSSTGLQYVSTDFLLTC